MLREFNRHRELSRYIHYDNMTISDPLNTKLKGHGQAGGIGHHVLQLVGQEPRHAQE